MKVWYVRYDSTDNEWSSTSGIIDLTEEDNTINDMSINPCSTVSIQQELSTYS